MKKILFIILLISSASYADECPIFKMSQRVKYKVDPFYSLVCSGNGKIIHYYVEYGTKKCIYSIEPTYKDRARGCPQMDFMEEKDIRAK